MLVVKWLNRPDNFNDPQCISVDTGTRLDVTRAFIFICFSFLCNLGVLNLLHIFWK